MDEPKLQFDRYADTYRDLHRESIRASGEEPGYFAEYKVAWMAQHLGIEGQSAGLSILDFGCGVGGTIPYVAKYFPQAAVRGVDISGESLELAREANPGIAFDRIDGAVPLPDASVDIAYAACVYHHIPPAERARWTAEIRRVLKPGGRFFIFEHNPLNPLTQKVVRECAFDDDAILLPHQESTGLFTGGGFTDARVSYIVFFPKFLGILRPLERLLGWLPLGAQYVAHGRA